MKKNAIKIVWDDFKGGIHITELIPLNATMCMDVREDLLKYCNELNDRANKLFKKT